MSVFVTRLGFVQLLSLRTLPQKKQAAQGICHMENQHIKVNHKEQFLHIKKSFKLYHSVQLLTKHPTQNISQRTNEVSF